MNKKIQWIIGGIVVAILAIVLISKLVGGNNQSGQVFGAGTRFPNGLSADSTSPLPGEVRGADLTLTDDAYIASTLGVATSSPMSVFSVVGSGGAVLGIASFAEASGNDFVAIDPNFGLLFSRSGAFINNTTVGGTLSLRVSESFSLDLQAMTMYSNGNVAFGSTTPNANFQATNDAANATTSIIFGKANQNKGTCRVEFDTAGSPVYFYIAAGATSYTIANGGTAPSGCTI